MHHWQYNTMGIILCLKTLLQHFRALCKAYLTNHKHAAVLAYVKSFRFFFSAEEVRHYSVCKHGNFVER